MQKKFISNLILLLALNFLVKPFYILGIEAEIQNRVGAEDYGNYFALISFSFLLNILLDMGVNNYNTRNIAQNSKLLKKHFSGLLSLRVLLMIVYIVVVLAIGFTMGYTQDQLWILLVLAFNQGLAASVLFIRSNLTGLHLFKEDSLISVTDRLLLIVMMSVLLWGGIVSEPFKIEWFVYGQTISYGVNVLIGLFLVYRKAGLIKFHFDKVFILAILKKSYPYALLIFLMMIHYKTDSVMLERMLPDGAKHAGVYAMGFRFFEAGNMIAYLFAVLLLPIFSRLIKNKEDTTPVVSLAFKILFSGALIVACACFVFDYEIMNLRYIEQVELASPIFGILMLSFIGTCMAYIFGTLLTANGSLRYLNMIALFGVVVNVSMNYILIPNYQAYGSAVASLLTQGLTAILQVVLVFWIFRFKLNYRFVLSLILFTVGVIILSYFSTIISDNWVLNAGILIGGGFTWAMLTGMLSIKKMVLLLQSSSD